MAVSISGSGAITGMVSADSSDLSTELDAKLDTPGAWTAYTPTVTSNSGSITSYTATGRYTTIGKTVIYNFDVVLTDAGTAGGNISVTMPIATSVSSLPSIGIGREYQVTGYTLQLRTSAASSNLVIQKWDNTFIGSTNHRFYGSITYEAA